MSNYLEELNDNQREAVLYNDGPSLVVAGAGSGKTRVLTYKIAYLLEQGMEPWSVLALTFTNKAAREMKARIEKQVGERAKYLWMGTFHSIFSRILRREAEVIGFSSNFTIYDVADSKSMIKTIIKDMQLDDKTYKPGIIQNRISLSKNYLILPADYSKDVEALQDDANHRMPLVSEIYRQYVDRCKNSNAMDFDDLLVYTYVLFRDHEDIRRKYADQFKYVLVDEYQDTNYAQHSIVLQLTKDNQRVCVVGDDAQSIYSFRGANIDNILKFTKLYKNAKLFKLERNYRSTQEIVNAANSLIAKNTDQIRKDVYSKKEIGDPLQVFSAYSDVEEGAIVVKQINHLHCRENCSYSDIAILYRTNAQSRIFEESLRKQNIPYKIYGGLSFYQRKEIKDVISYFRLAVNPNDEEAFKRIINYPTRGIGDITLNKISVAALKNNVSLWTILTDFANNGLDISKGTLNKLNGFRTLMEEFQKQAMEVDAYQVGMNIVKESGVINDIYQSTDPEDLSRQENLEELMNGLKDFVDGRQEEGNEHVLLSDYLAEISLLTDQDNDKDENADKVTLMTIHSAKGLEFRNVFIVGLEENLFPSPMSLNSERQLEEERRLFYVAITRAEEHCFLSFAKMRYKYGQTEFSSPSRFLRDIDSRYLNMSQAREEGVDTDHDEEHSRLSFRSTNLHRKPLFAQTNKPTASNSTVSKSIVSSERHFKKMSVATSGSTVGNHAPVGLDIGQVIEHERFGIGDVINIEGSGDQCKATVKFRNAGTKQLLLKFARFKVIE
ncbi:MAG: ATP-dependent helicase [Phocaeicola sp.]|uniref:ATP-dependent helicase n=1 Tax=Phocaeicola sp. TaxID=2773926 RepID=UPI003FA0EEBF